MSEDRYLADHADFVDEGTRLDFLESLYDPNSQRVLASAGVGLGWKCLEVGAGGGSVTRWLSSQVGPSGQIVSLDIDCRFLRELDLPNVEVREGSILKDEIEESYYDLVYARLMLQHIPEAKAALSRMVGAAKPGGWLVVEDSDFTSMRGTDNSDPRTGPFDKWIEDRCQYLRQWNIMDIQIGRRLAELFESAGLEDVQNEGTTWARRGGDFAGRLWNLTFKHNSNSFIESSLYTQEEWDKMHEVLLDPTFRFTDFTMFAAWGRRPKK